MSVRLGLQLHSGPVMDVTSVSLFLPVRCYSLWVCAEPAGFFSSSSGQEMNNICFKLCCKISAAERLFDRKLVSEQLRIMFISFIVTFNGVVLREQQTREVFHLK